MTGPAGRCLRLRAAGGKDRLIMSRILSVAAAFRSALAIGGAETLETIKQEIRSFCAPLGYDRFVLFSASAARDDVVERIYWVEGDWFGDGRDVDAETYIRRCPFRHHMLDQRGPFFWIRNVVATGEIYKVIRTPRGPGIFGYQVPIFGPTGLVGAVRLGGNRIDATPYTRSTGVASTCWPIRGWSGG